MSESFDTADVMICPGGPLLVRGARYIQDAEGNMHETDRPRVALCRCQKSSELPWCDATHKLLPADKRPACRDRLRLGRARSGYG